MQTIKIGTDKIIYMKTTHKHMNKNHDKIYTYQDGKLIEDMHITT
jgi:hypothetical protein